MGQIKIQESTIDLKNGSKGKIAVLMYVGDDDPVTKLDSAVSKYVGLSLIHISEPTRPY